MITIDVLGFKESKLQREELLDRLELESDIECVKRDLNSKKSNGISSHEDIEERVIEYASQRQQRTSSFVQSLRQKRLSYLQNLIKPHQELT